MSTKTKHKKTLVLICGDSLSGKDELAKGMIEWSTGNCKRLSLTHSLKDTCDMFKEAFDFHEGSFFSDTYKEVHKDFLNSAGNYVRALDPNLFANELTFSVINNMDDSGNHYDTIVVSDWFYANELKCCEDDLLDLDWDIKTVYVTAVNKDSKCKKEKDLIDKMLHEVEFDVELYFNDASINDLAFQGKVLAKSFGL